MQKAYIGRGEIADQAGTKAKDRRSIGRPNVDGDTFETRQVFSQATIFASKYDRLDIAMDAERECMIDHGFEHPAAETRGPGHENADAEGAAFCHCLIKVLMVSY